MIPGWKVFLQIFLDIMVNIKSSAKFNDLVCIFFPVGSVGHGQIISASDFVVIHKFVCLLDNLKTGFGRQGWFQANPGKNTSIVKLPEGVDSIFWECCAAFPFQAECVIQAGKRAGKSVASWAEEVNKWNGARSTFGEGAERKTMLDQGLNGGASEASVIWIKRIGCETKHDLFCYFRQLIFSGVFGKLIEKIGARFCSAVKRGAWYSEDIWNVAVRTFVSTPTVRISSKGGVFCGLSSGSIDYMASGDRYAVGVDVYGNGAPAEFSIILAGLLFGGCFRLTALFSEHLSCAEKIKLFCHFIFSFVSNVLYGKLKCLSRGLAFLLFEGFANFIPGICCAFPKTDLGLNNLFGVIAIGGWGMGGWVGWFFRWPGVLDNNRASRKKWIREHNRLRLLASKIVAYSPEPSCGWGWVVAKRPNGEHLKICVKGAIGYNLSITNFEISGTYQVLNVRSELEKLDAKTNANAADASSFGAILDCPPEGIYSGSVGNGLVDGIQVRPGDIFGEHNSGGLFVGEVLDDCGDRFLAGKFICSIPAFSGDDLICAAIELSDCDRLNESMLFYGLGKLLELDGIKGGSIIGAGNDFVYGQVGYIHAVFLSFVWLLYPKRLGLSIGSLRIFTNE